MSLSMETRFDDMSDGLRPIGRAAAAVVRAAGCRAICFWLDRTSKLHGPSAAAAFQHADHIRRQLDLSWGDLIRGSRAP